MQSRLRSAVNTARCGQLDTARRLRRRLGSAIDRARRYAGRATLSSPSGKLPARFDCDACGARRIGQYGRPLRHQATADARGEFAHPFDRQRIRHAGLQTLE